MGAEQNKLLVRWPPFREASAIKGYLAPYNERVDLIIDGRPQQAARRAARPRAEPSTRTAGGKGRRRHSALDTARIEQHFGQAHAR